MPSAVRVEDAEVVVSGLSGRLPESGSIDEFAQQLFDNVDLVTADDRRWTPGLYGVPERTGKLNDLAHFDASFFGVHSKQVNQMDPQMRILLELTHEAIIDAGYNPAELRGTRTGVYIGVSNSESEIKWSENPDTITGYAITGCSRAMFANRISYTFDFKGPSYAIDTACSSSTYALTHAFDAIRKGECDAAVVAGSNLCLRPHVSLIFHRLGMTSLDGRCAAFDASGVGYARAEAIVVVLLQRRKSARRLYATIRGARVNTDGCKEDGITVPNGKMQHLLAEETFQEAGLRPQDVAYVEAHGTGTKIGDPEEVNAIAEFFCKHRTTPLLIGSVKSNMGHSEPASGLCSIAKILIAMERGVIPANLHYKNPHPEIPALSDGRLKVVDRNTQWKGGLVAMNSFGFGGANAHVILESECGLVQVGESVSGADSLAGAVPRLVVASGRTTAGVQRMLSLAAAHPTRPELHALLDAVHAQNIPGHAHRGYTLLNHEMDTPQEDITELESGSPRPVWFVFSGVGTQWAYMARTLLRLPVFEASVRRSAAVLHPHNVDLLHILTEAPETAFDDNIINTLVAITAVQVALVDVLFKVGIRPDGIIGHSAGEVGCAYADETLSAEQTVLAAYWRGRSIVDAKLPMGAMAAVGLSWEQCAARCPAGVVLACNNADNSVTVSGPVELIEGFVKKLKDEGLFAKRVKSNVAFHTKYVEPALPLLRRSLQQLIPHPKPRSTRWISTSVPENCDDPTLGKLSDAEYIVNNLLSPVRFAEALRMVPAHALVVELAPHALLQAVLKRALPDAAHVPLLRREHPDQAVHLLAALGKMYCAGAQPQVARLYPTVQFPVPRGTPGLASAVEWDHSTEWSVAHYGSPARSGEYVIEYDLSRAADAFISGHNIDGRILFPATGYIILVWKTMAKLNNKKLEETSVVIENIEFRRATVLTHESPVRFLVNVLPDSGEFEVSEGGSVAVTGTVRLAGEPSAERLALPPSQPAPRCPDLLPLDNEDIYKELRLRGYNYEGVFRGIRTSDAFGIEGKLAWEDNWISFMDTMLQFGIIGVETRDLYIPTRLLRAHIDPKLHLADVDAIGEASVPVRMLRNEDTIVAGGIELRGVRMSIAPRRHNLQASPKLEKYVFLPYDNDILISEDILDSKHQALMICMQLVLENAGTRRIKITEVVPDKTTEVPLMQQALQMLEEEPLVHVEATITAGAKTASYLADLQDLGVKVQQTLEKECHVVLGSGVVSAHSAGTLTSLMDALGSKGILVLEEPRGALDEPAARALLQNAGLECVSRQVSASCEYLLLRRTESLQPGYVVIEIPDDDSYAWLEPLRAALQRAETEPLRVYLVARSPTSGLLGLGTCLRAEPGGHALRIYFLPGERSKFSPHAPAFTAQVRKDLAVNVLRSSLWGSYRHLPIADTLQSQLQVEHAYVNTLTRGDLSSLRWIESDLRYAGEAPSPPDAELCHVYYAPLNFRDIMLATGRLPPDALPGNLAGQECLLGLEFSGRTSSGVRVMGMVAACGLATTVQADKGFLWEVPAAWTLEEAATVPVVYATAYYALVVRGRMARGETVLVHAGSGGVGQAAIAIALHAGCTVFTTVGTADKRAFLRERFPALPQENIGNSRDTSFEQLVRRRTQGRGVDLVLNSLSEEMLLASVRCLAIDGRFLEIGKLDMSNDTALGMSMFLKNTTFHGILLDRLFNARIDSAERAAVVQCVTDGLANGTVRPLQATVFSDQQLEQAFRFMATGKHIGKVIVRVREEEGRGVVAPVTKLMSAIPRTYMHPGKSYVLVGGLGGFGLELGWWLVNRGARYLVVVGRRGVRSGYQSWCVRRWRARGVAIRVIIADAAATAGARDILATANQLAPIGGIFNLAAEVRDAFLENQTPENFQAVAAPKILATKALDLASRELAPQLDHFVVFSSVACGRGNAGQSNYGLANSAMERVVEQRQADGLAGLAIQWGAIGDVGLLQSMKVDMTTTIYGMLPQRMSSCLVALGTLLSLPHAVAASMVLADKRRAQHQPQQGLLHAVANILGIKDKDISKIPDYKTLAEFGMDSLMGTEIRQILEHDYDLVLNVQEIRALTFGKLKQLSGGESGEVESAGGKEAPSAGDDVHKPLLQLSRLGELMPKQVVVTLPSAAGSESAVFMVHPIEGAADMLQTLAAGVRGCVFGIQCTREAPLDDMSALACFYVQHVRAKQPHPPYTLLGYSFGAAVAFEMALQLQQIGCETQLVLVDGSPLYMSVHTTIGKEKRMIRNDATNEADVLIYFAQQIKDFDVSKVGAELEQLGSWEARVARVAAVVGAAPHEADALAAAASSFYRKLVVADSYQPAAKLHAPVHLFTARDNFVTLGEDYGLREVCVGAIHITQLPADHRSIITGDCAAVIAHCVSNLL